MYFRYALAIDPAHEPSLAGLLKILDREGRSEEALSWVRSAAAHPAATGRVLCLVAARFADAGAAEDAKKALATAAEREPNDPAVALAYADRLLDLGDRKEAEDVVSARARPRRRRAADPGEGGRGAARG